MQKRNPCHHNTTSTMEQVMEWLAQTNAVRTSQYKRYLQYVLDIGLIRLASIGHCAKLPDLKNKHLFYLDMLKNLLYETLDIPKSTSHYQNAYHILMTNIIMDDFRTLVMFHPDTFTREEIKAANAIITMLHKS